MITEIVITEVRDSGIIQQFVATTTAEVWPSLVEDRTSGMRLEGRRTVLVTDWRSPRLERTPLVSLLREGPRDLGREHTCPMCGHDCTHIGRTEGRDWWQCSECNWVSGLVIGKEG